MRQRKRKAVVYRSGSAVCIQGKFYCFANIARLLFIIIIPFFPITDAAARSFVWVTT